MNKELLKEIIISTIKGEKHLGNNLKKQCVDYIDDLQQRIDKAIEYIKSKEYEYEDDCCSGIDYCCDGYKLLSILKGEDEE